MPSKRLYIHTIGCQMNVYDSERMAAALCACGYTAAISWEDADLVIVNTCSVRAKSEQKAFSLLGRLESVKRRRPGMIVGVAGCVAQQEGARLLARAPYVDLVIGTRAVQRLVELVRRAEAGERPVVDVDLAAPAADIPEPPPAQTSGGISRFVTIMRGCDNFCAYCVVPHVRGRETSRRPRPSSRRCAARSRTAPARSPCWVRTSTATAPRKASARSRAPDPGGRGGGAGPHPVHHLPPQGPDPELIGAFGRLGRLCPHIHLPVQSGSDRILERMNRRYTRAHYLDIISKLRDSCDQIAVTTDMIVGFPGETRAEFEATLDLMRQVQFDSLFALHLLGPAEGALHPPPRQGSVYGKARTPAGVAPAPGRDHPSQERGPRRNGARGDGGGVQQTPGGRGRGGVLRAVDREDPGEQGRQF